MSMIKLMFFFLVLCMLFLLIALIILNNSITSLYLLNFSCLCNHSTTSWELKEIAFQVVAQNFVGKICASYHSPYEKTFHLGLRPFWIGTVINRLFRKWKSLVDMCMQILESIKIVYKNH
jgi:hypothetical protein